MKNQPIQTQREVKTETLPKELIKMPKKFSAEGKRASRVVVKIVAANVVNVVLLVALFYILGQLPVVARKIKELRNTQLAAQESADVAVINAELARFADKIDTLTGLRASDREFIEFIEQITSLKSEGLISEIVYPGGGPVVSPRLNSIGGRGYPVIFVLKGSQENVNAALSRIQSLPFLITSQEIELEVGQVAKGLPAEITMRLGVYFVVNDTFANN